MLHGTVIILTSFAYLGLLFAIASATSGTRFPSSAISDIDKPTTDGTCMRGLALTSRTRTLPLDATVGSCTADKAGLVLSSDFPLIRKYFGA